MEVLGIGVLLLLVVEQLHYGVMACSGRVILNATSGFINDGAGDYPASAHCEWLIEATGNNRYITLVFSSMKTECSYDYLFLYDGDSYSSPMIASYSGDTIPDQVLATSGHMLIYFFSDRNYVLQGFYFRFTAHECPHNCSEHGDCNSVTHQCTCYPGYRGIACDRFYCPGFCGDHGKCNLYEKRCDCDAGWTGQDCELSLMGSQGQGRWYTVAQGDSGFTNRTGHAGVFVTTNHCLYVFGGYTLNEKLYDFVMYCMTDGLQKWRDISKSNPWPSARYAHAMATYGDKVYMYGGVLANGEHSNELWAFDIVSSTWQLKAATSSTFPPGVDSPTITLVEDQWLYIFGGKTQDGKFLSDMFRIQIPTLEQWEAVISHGGKESDRRLIGHSTVYHPESHSLLVFGGFMLDYARFPKRSNALHAFHITEQYWSELHYDDSNTFIQVRAFHSAVIMGNYMVVVGGNTHIHHKEEVCYDSSILLYHLGCHRWVSLDDFEVAMNGVRSDIPKGRFRHVAVSSFGNILLVVGGYRGNVLGDLIAYKMPVSVAKNWDDPAFVMSANHCEVYLVSGTCKLDPECSWCQETTNNESACIHRSQSQYCLKHFEPSRCDGICKTLWDCGSCTVHGQGADFRTTSLHSLWHQEECAWCVKEAQCQKRHEHSGLCNTSIIGTVSGMVGWWGASSERPTTLLGCLNDDYPAGLHWISYRYPPDWNHPDNVEILQNSTQNYQFKEVMNRELIMSGYYTVMLRGFIHPLGANSSDHGELEVWVGTSAADCALNISTDDKPQNQEQVAKYFASAYHKEQAQRASDGPIFPHPSRGYRFYTNLRSDQRIADAGNTQGASQVQLEWTGATDVSKHVFTAEFLQPYESGECSSYTSCMACMTDAACGWCPVDSRCLLKSDTSPLDGSCGVGEKAHHLVTQALQCAVCADHMICGECAADPLCEWLVDEARCLRRGRLNDTIQDSINCPVPCQQRSNCSWCISEKNECAWCEPTRECFPFMVYMLQYAHGGCTKWLDSKSDQQCHDCARHTTCHACLTDFQCGWCGIEENPTVGHCHQGDFTGPYNSNNCSVLIATDNSNVSSSEPSAWNYGICPDVQECRLGLHDCHENATCINTFEKFNCTCNRGFMGDGKTTCERTCYFDCVHGLCFASPAYQCECDTGWTGNSCDINCGCHNHSTCSSGVGMCDSCLNWTTGEHCELCQAGSYGDATLPIGCQPCECNGHADPGRGQCNSSTGKCYCRDNTHGTHCDLCLDGYYGDPRNGSSCYLKCEGRTILGNITTGALGSYSGDGVSHGPHAYCLWILTVYSDLHNLRLYDVIPTITFTMERDIKTACSRDFVYVYDGIPGFMTSNPSSSATLLAAYCGYGRSAAHQVEARSGYLTVYFEAGIESASSTKGFNASYHVNHCPSSCEGNRQCVGNKCVCRTGYGGINCQLELCPGNCSEHLGYGYCNQSLHQCECELDHGGPACSEPVLPSGGQYQLMSDAWRHLGLDGFNTSLARMGHSLVKCPNNHIIMFGGYSLSHGVKNDLWTYHIDTNTWTEIKPMSDDIPSPRYMHAAVCVPHLHAMYVYGGQHTTTIRELWKFNLDSLRWTKLSMPSHHDVPIPALAGHSLTLIDQTRIWLIGGFSTLEYYSESVFEYDAANRHWSHHQVSGAAPTGIYGHSAIFHSDSSAIYVFGGYEYQTDVTAVSSNLYSIQTSNKRWSNVPTRPGNKPNGRFLHAAVGFSNHFVVLGGRSTDSDYDSSVIAYKYSCNVWINISPGEGDVIGGPLPAVIGSVAVGIGTEDIYVMGGFDSLSHATLTRLHLPDDLCSLFRTAHFCLNVTGCSMCTVQETNETYCYDSLRPRPTGCLLANTTVVIAHSGPCTQAGVVTERGCQQHTSCSQCLAEFHIYNDHPKVCKWCSNCPKGMCIERDADCDDDWCKRQQREITVQDQCVERLCQAASCGSCWNKTTCIWTRQFKRSSEVGRTLSLVPIYDWNCVTKSLLDATQYKIQSSPPTRCPIPCYQYSNCYQCLSSLGGEGGSQECIWSIPLKECMPPAYLPLRCSSGECGDILSGVQSQCPQKCSIHSQCGACLKSPGCGWCAVGGMNGLGVCMEGGLTGPSEGHCVSGNISLRLEPLPERIANWTHYAGVPPVWAFGKCPPENECLNGHHTCASSENCTDLAVGFRCYCKLGYARDSRTNQCRPQCDAGCEPHGTCVQPNQCDCHFGWVGHNCSTECLCNQHSNCQSVLQRDVCVKCHNNTMGASCQLCMPLYVGDPRRGGVCESCLDLCNHHSSVCMSRIEYNKTAPVSSTNDEFWRNNLSHGPRASKDMVCHGCGNNTEGPHCQQCKVGYFRFKDKQNTEPCQPCQCNGHSVLCKNDTGTECQCKNNTKSPVSCTSKDTCYKKQCSECEEGFLGTPTGGHQCYRHMQVDFYCAKCCYNPNKLPDPESDRMASPLGGCPHNSIKLLPHQTLFYAVQPKYLNVDIRVTIDITFGAADLYFSPLDDTFKVSVDRLTGDHQVEFDSRYKINSDEVTAFPNRRRRSAPMDISSNVTHADHMDPEKEYLLDVHEAVGLDYFVRVEHPDTFLVVQNIRNRLVITLPQIKHDLKVSRFYMILVGRSLNTNNYTSGIVFFRQDQPHIDLFVFFSVFFSSFFKLLAMCVLVWKIKQAVDARRSRHRRQLEMQHMASRPFGKGIVYLDPPPRDDDGLQDTCSLLVSSSRPRKTNSKLQPMLKFGSKCSLGSNTNSAFTHTSSRVVLTAPGDKETQLMQVNPLALEPTDDSVAAVGTFFFQLPGGTTAPVRACLGSSLVTMRVMYPNPYHSLSKATQRRRPSSSVV